MDTMVTSMSRQTETVKSRFVFIRAATYIVYMLHFMYTFRIFEFGENVNKFSVIEYKKFGTSRKSS